MRQTVIAIFCALTVFITSCLVINTQLWHSAQNTTLLAAHESVRRINGILDEAQQATQTAIYLSQQACSSDVQFALGREVLRLPHIRAVVMLRQNRIWCSSLTGRYVILPHSEAISAAQLTLYPGNAFLPGIPLMVWLTPVANGAIAVSISDAYLRDALFADTGESSLTLIVAHRQLSRTGHIQTLPTASELPHIRSSRYPFSIGYFTPAYFSLDRLIHKGGGLIAMAVFMSFITGGLIRRYLLNAATPSEKLKKAILRGEITPYYQPIVSGITGDIAGVEILARWLSPSGEAISPGIFIPVAEKNGLIMLLTQQLMQTAQAELSSIAHLLPDKFHIGLNISAAHFQSAQIMTDTTDFLASFKNTSAKLVLEITEREPLVLTGEVLSRLAALRSRRVVLALDDFGTGYAGLAYLNEFPVDIIKIDKSFVSRISDDPDSSLLVDCVIEMARKLSLSIVAEGVETQHQVDYLQQQGIPLMQGYYFYRPMPFNRLKGTIRSARVSEKP